MSSASMIGNTTCALSARLAVTRPINSSRMVACNASKKDTLSKIAGAAAAAQFAFCLPFAGVAVAHPQFDLAFGEDLKAQAEASDKKTSAEPTFSDMGKSLTSQFGQSNSAQDVGNAIKDNAPSPQGIVQGAKEAGNKLNKAADLSNVFDDVLGKAQDAAGDAAGSVKDAAGDVKGSAKSASGSVSGDVKAAAGDLKGAAKGTARDIQQATPDLSFGGVDEIIGKAQSAAGDAAGSAKSAVGGVKGDASSAAGNVASTVKQASGDLKGQAKDAGRQLDQATPDLSGVFDGLLDQGKSAVNDVKDTASKKVDDAGGDINAGAKRVVGEGDAIAKSAGKSK